MSHFAAIISPRLLGKATLLPNMNAAFGPVKTFEIHRSHNIEFGIWGSAFKSNEKKTVLSAFSGHIQNRGFLIEELKRKHGMPINEASDSEIILLAYRTWEEEFLKKIEGFFSLALLDKEKKMLLIARDPIGFKPLYWISQQDIWLFSTEIKSLLASGLVSQTPSQEAIAAYFHFGFFPQDLSPIKNVNKLLPGHYLKVNLEGETHICSYFSYSKLFEKKERHTEEEARAQLGSLLESSIAHYLPLKKMGVHLTESVGALTLSWFLSHMVSKDALCAYSVEYDENAASSSSARSLGLAHRVKVLRLQDILDELPTLVWHLDEPIADFKAIEIWHLAQLAREDGVSFVSDLGWKEMLGGREVYFHKFELQSSLAYKIAHLPKRARTFLMPFFRLFPSLKYKILRSIEANQLKIAFFRKNALFDEKTRKKASPRLYPFFDAEVFSVRFHRLTPSMGCENSFLYYDVKSKLPDQDLFLSDRCFGPQQIPVYLPYLQEPLVRFLAKLPEEIKFSHKSQGGLLKALAASLDPSLEKRMNAFSPPSIPDSWKTDSRLLERFKKLQKGLLVEEGFLSGKWVQRQLSYPFLTWKAFHELWALLVLETWFQLYISKPITQKVCLSL